MFYCHSAFSPPGECVWQKWGGDGGGVETQELSEEHFPWKILPISMKLICCDGHLGGFHFFLNCGCLKSCSPDN